MSDTPAPVVAWFPLLAFVRDARSLTTSGLIPEFVGKLKATVEAANSLTECATRLAGLIDGLFGGPEFAALDQPPAVGVGGVGLRVEDWRRRRLIERVKDAAQKEYRTHGLARVADDLARIYGSPPRSLLPVAGWEIEGVWPQAVAQGAEALLLAELSRIEGYRELVDGVGGPVIDWFRRAWQWVLDHQEQILAIGRILLMFLSLIALI